MLLPPSATGARRATNQGLFRSDPSNVAKCFVNEWLCACLRKLLDRHPTGLISALILETKSLLTYRTLRDTCGDFIHVTFISLVHCLDVFSHSTSLSQTLIHKNVMQWLSLRHSFEFSR